MRMGARPIIIGGFYRSGTTLLRRILDAHSRIHCGPEVKFLKDFFGDYKDDPLAHGRFFSTARTYGLPEEWLLSRFGQAFVEFHERAAAAAGKARWADKNPENVLFLDAWRTMLPEGFVFIEMVRDPLDALASLSEIGFRKTVPDDFSERVALYARFREAGIRQLRDHPTRSVRIQYERLARDPEGTVRGLMEWLDESFEPAALNALNAPERGSGIEDPKSRLNSRVHSQSVGRGSRDLPEECRRMVAERLGEFMVLPA